MSTKINIDKLVLSLLKSIDYNNLLIFDALKEQGLEVRNGQIVEISGNDGGISPATEETVRKNLQDNDFRRMFKNNEKVSPKFKEGDWVINGCNTLKIRFVGTEFYTFEFLGGYTDNMLASELDSQYRLWTLEDAEDGDVLHSTGFHNDCIFIFNGLDNWRFNEPNGDRAVATGYCCLSVSADKMEFGIQGPDCVETNTIKPATKIQRDLLFQKMKEAGYEWDAEKKELKKIEEWNPQVGDVFRKKGTENPLCHLCGINENGNFSFVEDRISGIAGGTDISVFTLKKEYEFVGHRDTDPFKAENGTKELKETEGVKTENTPSMFTEGDVIPCDDIRAKDTPTKRLTEKDLMIGDWVLYDPNVFIEDEYEPSKELFPTRIKSGEDIDLAIEGCYAPIPITTEILEKNGFEKRTYLDSETVTYYLGDGFYIEKESDKFALVDNVSHNSYNRFFEYSSNFICGIKYIHQLQRAITLFGIEKEIEL